MFFTDSQIVFIWIRSQSRTFKPYLSVRVCEIQSKSDPCQWHHIPEEFNVADDVSRGIEAESLEERWKHGPELLYRPESEWPQGMNDANERTNEEETVKFLEYGKSVAVNITIKSPEKCATTKSVRKLIDCRKFSSWRKLLRVTCYVLLFIKKFQAKHSVKNNQ